MKFPFGESSVSTRVVVPSAIVVAILAVMQYRWSTGVSEATAVRLADSLQMSLVNWQIDFFRSLSDIAVALQPTQAEPRLHAQRVAAWRAVSRHPDLVAGVYWHSSKTWRIEPDRAVPIEAPAAVLQLQPHLAAARSPEWRFDARAPALVHPAPGAEPAWVILTLNRDALRDQLFAELSHTYFQGTAGLDYLVAVIDPGPPLQVLYSSDAGFGDPEPADADGAINLFAGTHPSARNSPVRVFHAPSEDQGPSAAMRIAWFAPLRAEASAPDWRLVVRHRRGGALGAFVAEMRRRDLAIGFGVLLVLVINMAMLILTSHRAERLAQLQMNFVTAVSHELRTPLTVIISGADNICNGVVASAQQMRQYGSLIGKQARQLTGLVERILLFAETRQGQHRYQLRPLPAQEAIEAALTSSRELIEAAGFELDCQIPPGLPPVRADATALSQCLQNLITNALKYGRQGRWLGIRAETAGGEVRIHVSDRGSGIDPADLPHIFEPFYRSPSARAAQIGGTGLGLALSQSLAQAMHGRITVSSSPGAGSTFTLHLATAGSESPAQAA
jgi:signal transduction histidine kinase